MGEIERREGERKEERETDRQRQRGRQTDRQTHTHTHTHTHTQRCFFLSVILATTSPEVSSKVSIVSSKFFTTQFPPTAGEQHPTHSISSSSCSSSSGSNDFG